MCLSNGKALLDAAAALLERKLDHIAFHLIVLALEEIGKPEIVAMQALSREHRPGQELKLEIDDHEKKLFWAIWGPSFGREQITGQQIKEQLGLARTLHENRKRYLYADPSELVLGQAKMREGEARTLFDFAEVRHKLASASNGMRVDVPKEDEDNVRWFMETTTDPQRRREIFGSKSQDKLLEFGDAKKWIRWLRETYDAHEEATRALIKEEVTRQRPSGEQAYEPKWRVRVKLVTPSHAIRNKPLNDFNERSDYIKLAARVVHRRRRPRGDGDQHPRTQEEDHRRVGTFASSPAPRPRRAAATSSTAPAATGIGGKAGHNDHRRQLPAPECPPVLRATERAGHGEQSPPFARSVRFSRATVDAARTCARTNLRSRRSRSTW